MLGISNISKSYQAKYLFKNVTFNMGMEDRIAVIGANGSGKTTLFEIISGDIIPDSGNVSVRRLPAAGHQPYLRPPAPGRGRPFVGGYQQTGP
jgi:ATPase subunit of ABC transporter with duplicated ATPase domains